MLPLDSYHLNKVSDALWPEAKKYNYVDRNSNQPVSAQHALYSAVELIWKNPGRFRESTKLSKSWPVQVQAVYVIEAIAEQICRTDQVRVVDRREKDRRHELVATATYGQQFITPALLLGCIACTVVAASSVIGAQAGRALQAIWTGTPISSLALRVGFGVAAGLSALGIFVRRGK